MTLAVRDALWINLPTPLPDQIDVTRSAWKWIRDDVYRFGSFRWVSEQLGFHSHEDLRRTIERLRDAQHPAEKVKMTGG